MSTQFTPRDGRWQRGAALLAVAAAALLAACSGAHGGTSLGELNSAARRVKGGGAECPLSLDVRKAMRGVGFQGVVVADQLNPAHAADGLVSTDDAGGRGATDSSSAAEALRKAGAVRVSCRFLFGSQRLTVVVVGAKHGHALSVALNDIRTLAAVSAADAAAFVNLMADRRPDDAEPVNASAEVAAAKVATSDGSDQAVVVALTAPLAPSGTTGADLDPGVAVVGQERLLALTVAISRDISN